MLETRGEFILEIRNSKLFSLYNCFPLPPPVTITIRAFEKLTLDNQKFTVKNETK